MLSTSKSPARSESVDAFAEANPTGAMCIGLILRAYGIEGLSPVLKAKHIASVEAGKTIEQSMETLDGRRKVYAWAKELRP